MQRLCLLLPLATALIAPTPAARSIAVRPNSYLDDLPAAAATKPAPAPVAAPAPAPAPAPKSAPAIRLRQAATGELLLLPAAGEGGAAGSDAEGVVVVAAFD